MSKLHRNLTTTTAIFCLVLFGALAVSRNACSQSSPTQGRSPYDRPGTVWTDSIVPLGFGTDLILLQDGTYASTDVCDICGGDDFLTGSWLDKGARILLTPSKNPKKEYILVKETRYGCDFLRDDTPALKFHPTFVKKSDQTCIRLRLNEIHKESANPAREPSRARP
jgi:hypothetical protein